MFSRAKRVGSTICDYEDVKLAVNMTACAAHVPGDISTLVVTKTSIIM